MDAPRMEYLMGLKARLDATPAAGRGPLVDAASQTLRCSVQTVYRHLREVGWTSGRKTRADKGQMAVDEDLARKVAGLVKVATRAHGKRTMPITVACDVLANNGYGVVNHQTGEITMPSPTTVARAMRIHGCHPDQLERGNPAQELRSLHPNHVWQLDASLCVLFYLPRGQVRVMDEAKFYKNKPANLARAERDRVWRLVVTDHYSGGIFFHYVLGAEDAMSVLDTLIRAMIKRGADDPMHGVPNCLLTDKGAGNCSALVERWLKALGIVHLTHMAGNPRAKGQCEQAQNLIETQFEGRLACMQIANVEQLNAAADTWRIHWNANAIHGRHGRTRNSAWLTITQEQLRVAPSEEMLRDLVATEPRDVKVSPRMVISHSIKGHGSHDYDLRYLTGISSGQTVRVVVNPYRAPAVDVIIAKANGSEIVTTVEPIIRDAGGFRTDAQVIGAGYAALPDTHTDKLLKDIQREAYATDSLADAAKAAKDRKPAYQHLDMLADTKAAPTYIPRRGTALEVEAARREVAPLAHVEAAKLLRSRVGDKWNADAMAWLRQRYPDGVPQDAIDDIAARFTEPTVTTAAPLRLVAAGGM
ncbi:DDE-type integrase/transposase/recombinase [Desulfovibrio psychrotolerans]|uniref:Integrase n=1 Tax=Desulfovibrio psychrotolerans TaxID=415242 RepID=A0A7J0BVG3_9BACT|nr:DDE-type integrase/transposase/recombinase [Desulfovibrio psychrotolerans]GFM37709.1 integrase [Desulfovibrio psychrotolerans]